MPMHLHNPTGAIFLLQLLLALFLAILFLQSGIDKVVDWNGNLSWLTGHFAKSPLARFVPAMVVAITLLELAAGLLSLAGAVLLLNGRGSRVAFYGAIFSALALLALFFGQRIAKDYPGAATLVSYFVVALAGIYLLGWP